MHDPVWHVLSPVDPVREDNGSAVQRVAREIVAASRFTRGAVLVTGMQAAPKDDIEAILHPARRWDWMRDTLGRFTSVRPRTTTRAVRAARAQTFPRAIVLHNQHKMASAFRSLYPRVPIILYAHNEIWKNTPRPAARLAMRDIDGIVTVSRDLEDVIRARLRESMPPARVILSGAPPVSESRVTPIWDVVYVGRVIPEKGVHILVDALAALADAGVRPRTSIIGSSWFYGNEQPKPYELKLRAKCEQHDLDVTFSPAIPPGDVATALDSARIAVVPSVWREPLGLAALEAMASRAALIYSGVGGIPEIASGSGWQFRAADPYDLARSIDALLSDEPLRRAISNAGSNRAAALTWDRTAHELDDFIEEIER